MSSSSLDQSVLERIAGFETHYFPRCDSTNSIAAQMAREKKPVSPFLVATDYQTGGVGRHGRGWFSREGRDIACTFVFPLSQCRLPRSILPLATGLSTALALESLSVTPVGLKWPNDIILNGKKAGGILCRIIGDSVFLAGIGVNHSRFGKELPPDLRGSASAIGDMAEPPERTRIIAVLAETLLDRLTGQVGEKEILDAWQARSVTLGREVTALIDSEILRGTDLGLTAEGELRIGLPEGDERRLLDCLELRPV